MLEVLNVDCNKNISSKMYALIYHIHIFNILRLKLHISILEISFEKLYFIIKAFF